MKEFDWNNYSEGTIYRPSDSTWIVRTGVVVNKPTREKRYEDSFVCLSSVSGDSNSILGYVLQAKKPFHAVFEQETYVSLLSNVSQHDNLKVVFNDQKVYLYKFNRDKTPSYWFLFRNKVS